MDDQPPNPTDNNPLKETTSSQQTDEVADDRKKRETDQKKKKIIDDDSVDRGADSSTGSRIDDDDDQSLALQESGEMTSQITKKMASLETDEVAETKFDGDQRKKTNTDDDSVDPTATNSSTSSRIDDAEKMESQITEKMASQETEVGDEKKKKKNKRKKKIDQVPMFLFQKKLELEDANPNLNQLVIWRCRDVMTTALATAQEVKKCDHVRVTTTDQNLVEYQLRFMRYSNGRYALHHQWGDIVTANGLQEGDRVVGWGNYVGDDEIQMVLHIYKTVEAQSDAESGEKEKVVFSDKEQVMDTTEDVCLFYKNLDSGDTNTLLNRVVVGYCKEVMKMTLARVREVKKCDHVKIFMQVDASSDNVEYQLELRKYPGGRFALYEFGAVVSANRLKKGDRVFGWGNLVADDHFRCLLHISRDAKSKQRYIP